MRGPYPGELRIRVIHFVEAGGSRREAAEQFQVSASSTLDATLRRRWGLRINAPWREHFPLEKYSQQILALIREQPDLTLNEIVSVLHRRRIPREPQRAFALLRSSGHYLQKLQAAERKRADVARARRRWICERGWLDTTRLVFIDETAVTSQYGAP